MYFYIGMFFCYLNMGYLISNEFFNFCFFNVWKFLIIYSYIWFICLRFLKRDEFELWFCMLWLRIVLDRDFELLGFLIRNNGIWSLIYIIIMKKFFFKVRFFVMLLFNFKFCKKVIWYLFYEVKKILKWYIIFIC